MTKQSDEGLNDAAVVIANALNNVAEAIEGVGQKLARYLPDCPDRINEEVASSLVSIAEAISEHTDATKKIMEESKS
jgi:hypothetical protein